MNEPVGLWVALTAGVVSFLSPCVLPLVPSYLSFVTGMSLEDLQGGVDRRATFMHSLLFVLGFSIIFITLGASASFLGSFLRYYEVWIARVGGAVIMENLFNLPGLGRLLVDALTERDYPVVSGVNLFFACIVLLNNLFIDLIYAYLDPRIRYQ